MTSPEPIAIRAGIAPSPMMAVAVMPPGAGIAVRLILLVVAIEVSAAGDGGEKHHGKRGGYKARHGGDGG